MYRTERKPPELWNSSCTLLPALRKKLYSVLCYLHSKKLYSVLCALHSKKVVLCTLLSVL